MMEINGGYGEQRRRHWEREEKRVSKGSKGREKQVWRSDGNKKRVTGAEPVTLGARPPLTPKGFSVPELSFVSFQSIRKCCWALLFPPAGLRSSLDALIHRVVQGPVFNKKRKEKKRKEIQINQVCPTFPVYHRMMMMTLMAICLLIL